MRIPRKMLVGGSILQGLLLSGMILIAGCKKNEHVDLPAKEKSSLLISADVYFRNFESTSIVDLDDNALKTASDMIFSVIETAKIEKLKHELDVTPCVKAPDVADVGDVRLLVELRDGENHVHVWHASQFYFQDGLHGRICEFNSLDKQRLEKMLRALEPAQERGQPHYLNSSNSKASFD
ncbi:hypothetical protein [Rhodanobacter lindaniclasticus]